MSERGDIMGKPDRAPADPAYVTAMAPMRDGVRLATHLFLPAAQTPCPIILIRTPYGLDDHLRSATAAHVPDMLHPLPRLLFEAGYGIAYQHVRGKHGSEGLYEMNRPPAADRGGATDHVTDAWDTVAWLIDTVPQGNGRVAALGLSYDGFTALSHLLDPHPALAACVAINPMVDCWISDDWFRNGAFRQQHALAYVHRQTSDASAAPSWPSPAHDEYAAWLDAGSAQAMAERIGVADYPAWRRLTEHAGYDAYWRGAALDRRLAASGSSVPTLHVHSQWDVEDPYGSIAAFQAIERAGSGAANHLVSGPWSHACPFFTDGDELGPLRFGVRTARQFRETMLLPFLNAHCRDEAPSLPLAKVSAYSVGAESWLTSDHWPLAQDRAQLYLAANEQLVATASPDAGHDDYLSDPAKPVTNRPRPILAKNAPGFDWERSAVADQRFAGDRSDVLRYSTPPLIAPLQLAGPISVNLFASTSGTDADWFVKIIDAYPDDMAGDAAMSGYQLTIADGAIRGRFAADPGIAQPLEPDAIVGYRLTLPSIAYTLLPGHRLMIQVQSTMFPLYDRNPQRFVPNIFFAGPDDFVKATHRIHRGGDVASSIELPVRTPLRW